MSHSNKTKDITEISDYPALKKLSEALWQQDSSYHGASVMVGAGFSRSAAITGDNNKKLPLWYDLSAKLAEDLGESRSTDALRLAQIYHDYFGKQQLHDLIKQEINDNAWEPTELHRSLLQLPWSEVLTTNWETLLEKASQKIHEPIYSIVHKPEDLSSCRSPRIVKLHGTIGITNDLIFTQEEYRCYPQQFAAFVNFAKQVYVENELCLIGFSGDDPNFLQWVGWVRDNLKLHARRIYLVGVLNLTVSKRKYFETLNIAPIDLYSLVADNDDVDLSHKTAIEFFLKELWALKPTKTWEWSPTKLHQTTLSNKERNARFDLVVAAQSLEKQLQTLINDREAYPGWLVCPNNIRLAIQNQLSDPYPTHQILSQLEPAIREKLLYEIAWRYKITYQVISDDLLEDFFKICDPATPCNLSKKQQLELALLLLKNTRWMEANVKASEIREKMTSILEHNLEYWSESVAELAYFQAIVAREKFDYLAIEKLIYKISGQDPIWNLRKACLLSELARYQESKELIEQVFKEISLNYRHDRQSVYLLSRLAWVNWIKRSVDITEFKSIEDFPSKYQVSKCDPTIELDTLKVKITKLLEKQQQPDIEPSFKAGYYTDKSKDTTFSNEIHPFLLFDGISNDVGLPIRWRGVGFLTEAAFKLSMFPEIGSQRLFSLVTRSSHYEKSPEIKKVLTRIRLAWIPQEEANKLIEVFFKVTEYWLTKRSSFNSDKDQKLHSIDHLRVCIEILARLQIRATPEMAKKCFILAMHIGKNEIASHIWLYDSLQNLIDYSLESVPTNEHCELLLDALDFPFIEDPRWPNPIIVNPGERAINCAFDTVITKLIQTISPKSMRPLTAISNPLPDIPKDLIDELNKTIKSPVSPSGETALSRLLPLVEKKFTTPEENKLLADAIYGENFSYKNLPATNFSPDIFLTIPPEEDKNKLRKLISSTIFPDRVSFEIDSLYAIVAASVREEDKLFPSPDQAIEYFDEMVKWRYKNEDKKTAHLFNLGNEEQIGKLIGDALSASIVPSLPKEAFNQNRFNELYQFCFNVKSETTIRAFIYFLLADPLWKSQVEQIIKKGLRSKEPNIVANSAYAILDWGKLTKSEREIQPLIDRLIYLIESGHSIGLSALMWTVNEILNAGWLTKENINTLEDSLPEIFDSTDYIYVDDVSREAVSISYVRAACVRLARDILKQKGDKIEGLQKILAEAKHDALPEVRFAEMTKV